MRFILLSTILLVSSLLWADSSVVIVDDFKTDYDWQSLWRNDLQKIGIKADIVSVDEVESLGELDSGVVVWNCGNSVEDTLTTKDQEIINAYLSKGGNLFLIAPGLPSELFQRGSREWLKAKMGCDYVMPNSPITWSTTYLGLDIAGVEGSILENIEFSLTFGPESKVPADELTLIHSTDDRCKHVVEFTYAPGYLGVARETPINRTLFLTFPMESIKPNSVRQDILKKSLDWLLCPRMEGRGIWVVRNQMISPENIDHIVDACADANFNALYVQVRGRGDAYYNSATEPRTESLSDQPVTFDPLKHCIERAHKRGLEVHAWLNAGYIWNMGDLPENPKHILNRHPDYVMVNRSGKSQADYTDEEFQSQYSEGRFLSLAAPEVQDYLTGVYLEIVKNYDVDGIHFDFIRYPSRGVEYDYDLDYNPLVVKAFRSDYNYDPHDVEIDSKSYLTWLEWQRKQIGILVGGISKEAKSIKPGIRISVAALSRYYLTRHQAMQDWIAWLRKGQIDTACIMAYDEDIDLVVQECLLGQENRGNGTIWVGMGAGHDINLIIDRISSVRSIVKPEGIMFFPWGGLDESELNELKTRPFVSPAKVPPVLR